MPVDQSRTPRTLPSNVARAVAGDALYRIDERSGRVILYADQMTGSMTARHRRDRSPPREAGGIQYTARHHAGKREEVDRRVDELGLRRRPRAGGYRRRHGRRCHHHRAQFRRRAGRSGSADARGRADLDFEEAARLRDEVKRLRATRTRPWSTTPPSSSAALRRARGGGYKGEKKYGDAANLPARLDKAAQGKARGKYGKSLSAGGGQSSKVHKPGLDEMGIATGTR